MPNPRDIVKKLLNGEEIDGCNFESYEAKEWCAYGMSAATSDGIKSAKGIQDCLIAESAPITSQTIFNIASITKTFTAATILRMIEDERFAKFLPENIDTKLSEILPFLKSRYPSSVYIQGGLEAENNFGEMTLKNLLNHTSGIGDFEGKDFAEKLRCESPESLAEEPDGKFFALARKAPRPEFGKYSYSNLGYELLGMVIAAVGSAVFATKVKCGDVVRELVIDRLKLPHSFTQDQLEFAGEKVQVVDRPDQPVAQAYDVNFDGKPHPSLVFRRAIATSGIYSSSEDLCKFAAAFFSQKTFGEGGLFDQEKTIEMRDSNSITINERGDFYAIGYEAYTDASGVVTKLHGAKTAGFFGWLGYRDGKAACCLVNCVNTAAQLPILSASAKQLSCDTSRAK